MSRLLTWFPSIAPLQRRFAAASSRERVLIGVSAYLLAGVFLYYAVLNPAMDYRSEQLRAQVAAANGLSWMIANQTEARQRGGDLEPTRGESKLTVISSSAELHNLMIKRVQPAENRINVELSTQEYSAVIKWLIALETDHDMTIVDVRLEKVDEGIVDSRITLR